MLTSMHRLDHSKCWLQHRSSVEHADMLEHALTPTQDWQRKTGRSLPLKLEQPRASGERPALDEGSRCRQCRQAHLNLQQHPPDLDKQLPGPHGCEIPH